MLQSATPDQTTALMAAEQAAQQAEQSAQNQKDDAPQFTSALAGHIQSCFDEAERAKQIETNERLLNCQRLRRGKYSAQEKAEIDAQGGSDIFINLTNIKCRAAESWIKDIMLAQGNDKPWTLEATPIPDLPGELQVEVTKIVAQEEAAVKASGAEVHPDAFQMRKDEITEEFLQKLNDLAADRARNMERLIDDQMLEGKFLNTFRDFISDFCTFPCAFLMGPVVRKRRTLSWGESGIEVKEDLVREFERISPFDVYPAPDAVTVNDGYLCVRRRLFVQNLEAMKGVEGYKDEAIAEVIKLYGDKGYAIIRSSDSERDALEARPLGAMNSRSTIEAIQFFGPISGKMLKEWASVDAEKLNFKKLDDTTTYEVEGWLVGATVVKAVLNPDPLGQRPVDKASWDDVPGAFWGSSPPEIMGDVQRMINACARALANNMAISSGPQAAIDISRLPPGTTGVEEMYPWKIWQFTGDRSGGGHPGIDFFQPKSNASELQATMDWFYKKADEVTGIPNYAYGSSSVAGAGRTASGLSMLMENASKGIRQAIANVDVAVTSLITRMFNHNMLFAEDDSVKGDAKIVAKGAMGLIAREALQARRNEFLQATTNPLDSQIMGTEGRAYLLRELGRGLQMDINKIVPDPDRLKAMSEAQAAQQTAPKGPSPEELDMEKTLISAAAQIVAAQVKAGQSPPAMQQVMNAIEGTAASMVGGGQSQPPAAPQGASPPAQGAELGPAGQPMSDQPQRAFADGGLVEADPEIKRQEQREHERQIAAIQAAGQFLAARAQRTEAPANPGVSADELAQAVRSVEEMAASIASSMSKPRKVVVQRDESGKVVGAVAE